MAIDIRDERTDASGNEVEIVVQSGNMIGIGKPTQPDIIRSDPVDDETAAGGRDDMILARMARENRARDPRQQVAGQADQQVSLPAPTETTTAAVRLITDPTERSMPPGRATKSRPSDTIRRAVIIQPVADIEDQLAAAPKRGEQAGADHHDPGGLIDPMVNRRIAIQSNSSKSVKRFCVRN